MAVKRIAFQFLRRRDGMAPAMSPARPRLRISL